MDESDKALPEIPLPEDTDHPVLATILAELRSRTAQSTVVAHYEDAP